jgi:hypothetical protein
MAPVPNSTEGTQTVKAITGGFCGGIALVVLRVLVTTIYIFCYHCWHIFVKDGTRYLEREKFRAKWNRAAYIERRRQDIVEQLIRDLIEKKGYSEEKRWLLLELVRKQSQSEIRNRKLTMYVSQTQRTYFPARKHISHPGIMIFRDHMWDKIEYKLYV